MLLCQDLHSFVPSFSEQQLSTLLCPATTALAKCVSKFLGIISETRKEIDLGLSPQALQVYQRHRIQPKAKNKKQKNKANETYYLHHVIMCITFSGR